MKWIHKEYDIYIDEQRSKTDKPFKYTDSNVITDLIIYAKYFGGDVFIPLMT